MPAHKDGPGRTSLVVVSYASSTLTEHLVAKLADAVDEVVVVDNGPEPSLLRDLAAERHHVRVVDPGRNLGYGAGANLGAHHTTGEVLFIANPDVEIDPADLGLLTSAVRQPGVALAAPKFVNPDGSLQRSAHRRDPRFLSTLAEFCYPLSGLIQRLSPGWHPTLYSAAEHETARDTAHVLGALLAVRREAFDAVGGFDETFFLYREETDLCHRLRHSGWRVRHEPSAVVVHEGGASTDTSWPHQGREHTIISHYHYIAKHWGRVAAGLAWAMGLLSATSWWLIGPHRQLAGRVVRLHVGQLARLRHLAQPSARTRSPRPT